MTRYLIPKRSWKPVEVSISRDPVVKLTATKSADPD